MERLTLLINLEEQKYTLEYAICNVIAYFTSHQASDNLKLDYDETKKELVISCNNIHQNNFPPDSMNIELRHSLWTILTKKVNIQVVTPTLIYEIANKDLPTADIKDLGLNINSRTVNEIEQNAKVIFKPIEKNIIPLIRENFVGLQDWEIIFKTKYGDLLIANKKQTTNHIYLNGIKLINSNNLIDNIPEWNFVYSYNLKNNEELKNWFMEYFIVDHFFSKLINPLTFEKYIALILDNLDDNIKENIYLNILNNTNSYEWNVPGIKKIITNFFSKSYPGIYLITTKDNENSIQCKLAKEQNKEIIYLPFPVFSELKEKNFWTVNGWVKQYYIENLNHPIDFSTLNSIESSNWKQISQFAKSFVNNNQQLKDYLTTINCSDIPIVVVDNLPVDYVWLEKIHQIWINKPLLGNLTNFLSALFHAIWRMMPKNSNYYDFIRSWTNLLIRFCNNQAFKEPTSQIDDKIKNNNITVKSTDNKILNKNNKVHHKKVDLTHHKKLITKKAGSKRIVKSKAKIKNKVSKKINKTAKTNNKKLNNKNISKTTIKIKTHNHPSAKITFTNSNEFVSDKQKYYLSDIKNLQLKSTLPIYYHIEKEGWIVKTWKDVLQITLMYLYQHHHHDNLIKYLKQRDIYLGEYKRTLANPRCVPNTNYWFATNYQTKTIIDLCVDLFHYFKDSLNQIYFILK